MVMETMSERCRRLCGGSEENCFVKNKNQLSCIADMVVNKLSGILEVMEHAAAAQYLTDAGFVDMALGNVREVINWVKFLQITHDLRVPGVLVFESIVPEKRRELRYPMPEIYGKYIVMEIYTSGSVRPAVLSNFSRYGIQFTCPEPLDIDSVKEGVVRSARDREKAISFKVRIRHCTKCDGGYVVGGRIETVSGSDTFDFFKNVHDFVLAAITKS